MRLEDLDEEDQIRAAAARQKQIEEELALASQFAVPKEHKDQYELRVAALKSNLGTTRKVRAQAERRLSEKRK